MDRRLFIKILFSSLLTPFFSFSNEYNKKKAILKKIPKSEEYIASIGMGTWLTFDIGFNTKKLKQRAEILKLFFNSGGQVIDSSPMYGTSEKVIGKSLKLLIPIKTCLLQLKFGLLIDGMEKNN